MDEIVQMSDRNIALLIDCDNISSRYIDRILGELSKNFRVTYKRMYGDFTKTDLHSWLTKSAKFSLTPIHIPADTPGKNASDIGLIIDAMDILYTGGIDGFCIVSSDGDFNKLAKRIRESGKIVIGMGEKKTPESFRASCERFISLDIMENVENQEFIIDTREIEDRITEMIYFSNNNSMDLAEIGNRLVRLYPDFDIRNYNYSKLSDFLKSFNSLVIRKSRNSDLALEASIKTISVDELNSLLLNFFTQHKLHMISIEELKKSLNINPVILDASIKEAGFMSLAALINHKLNDFVAENGNVYINF